MPDDPQLTQQLRLLGELRDLLERWLDLAAPGQRNVEQVQALLMDIQRVRNALLVASMSTAGLILAQQLKASEALVSGSLHLLRNITGPLSPLANLAQEFVRRAELLSGPHGSGGSSND